MDRSDIYDKIADRKSKPADDLPYTGGNGRVDKCVKLFRQGKLKTGGVLVDVGGAIGDLGYALRDDFHERWVIDISWKFANSAREKGNKVLRIDVDKDGLHPFEDLHADVVTALDFIEHIVDPEQFARECYRVLQPDGQVFINTPNIRFWPHIEQLLREGTFPHTSGDREVFHGGHLAFFTYKDLCTIFGSAGFGNFEMVMDEEGYRQPPHNVISECRPRNQEEYKRLSMEFGCPNLLFICEKL